MSPNVYYKWYDNSEYYMSYSSKLIGGEEIMISAKYINDRTFSGTP